MISPATRERFLKEEGGFTLVEMITSMVLMVVVLSALYSVSDMTLRVFSVGNAKVEAVESARVGMEKMEREIRAAYPVDASVPATNFLFFSANGVSPPAAAAMPTASQITFGNELGVEGAGDGKITCGSPCEYITYKLTDDASNTPCTASPCSLRRVNTASSSLWGDPLGENVFVPGGLTFTYLKSDGTPATSEGDIAKVRVRLRITVKPNTEYEASQILKTDIDLRNR